jgi:hypothetical protein
MSSRECERELLRMSSVPVEIANPEKERSLNDELTELKLVLDAELLEKLKRIQALRSHADPSGKRCGSRYFLEIDHIQAVALDGGNEPDNLRLLCRSHNTRAAVKTFGRL